MPGNLTQVGKEWVAGLYKPGFQAANANKPWKYLILELVNELTGEVTRYSQPVAWSQAPAGGVIRNASPVTFTGLDTSKRIRKLILAFDDAGTLVGVAETLLGSLLAHTGTFTIEANHLHLRTGGTQSTQSQNSTLKLAYQDPIVMDSWYSDGGADSFTVVGYDSGNNQVFSATCAETDVIVDTTSWVVIVQVNWTNGGSSTVTVEKLEVKRNGQLIHTASRQILVAPSETLVLTLKVYVG